MGSRRHSYGRIHRDPYHLVRTIVKQIVICIIIVVLIIAVKKMDIAIVNQSLETFQSYMGEDYTTAMLTDSAKSVFSYATSIPEKLGETLSKSEKSMRFIAPADKDALIAAFGEKEGYLDGETSGFERGMKFSANEELQIYAVSGGTVAQLQKTDAGTTIKISHGNQINSVYSGCSFVYVSPLEKVKKGQLIASIAPVVPTMAGNTEAITEIPCLSFELWVDNQVVNPMDYIDF